MTDYFRPLVRFDLTRPATALSLAGGAGWFAEVEHLTRHNPPAILPASAVPSEIQARLCASRADVAGLSMARPQIMGILNVTPDSFSDGGQHGGVGDAVAHALRMEQDGASIIDIGGESTRPGAAFVPVDREIERTVPVIQAIRKHSTVAISIDTRKAPVAETALNAGANLINDVSGLVFDPAIGPLSASRRAPVCIMHAQGDPETMQDDPHYDDVLLDVYDFLAQQADLLEAQGVPRDQIMVDPGIGFGKTLAHNLALLNRLSLFHALGCPILLGASRKRFIGTVTGVAQADQRVMGSVAVALAGMAQGVQMVRVHDVAETQQALAMWQAVHAR